MKKNNITVMYNKIDNILDNLNAENKKIIFFSYRNVDRLIAKKNNLKIQEWINNNNNYTFLTICIRNFFSINDIGFNFYSFQNNCKKIIVKLIFKENDENNLKLFINFLEKYNFINFVEQVIEKYLDLVNILPQNVYLETKANKELIQKIVKEQNKNIVIVRSFEHVSKYKKDILLYLHNLLTLSSLERKLQTLRKKMKKVWSISTTVRNPERLRNFLITLKEIEGKEWNKDTQIEFQIRLIKNRFYGFGSTQFYNNLSHKQIDLIENINHKITFKEAKDIFLTKNYEDPAMRGRTSFKPLQKMGLATIVKNKIKITPLGKYFLRDDYDLGEMFFKSFIKWQYPNPVDRDFNDGKIYNLKPFILTLHLINKVNSICKNRNIKIKGISKLEFEIFGQTLLNYKDLTKQANYLIDFRLELEKIKDHKKRKEFIDNYINSFLSDFTNIDYNNLKDYADNTIRYFRLTRFIYIRGGGYYIDLEPRRMIEIENLLNTYDGSSESFTKEEYIQYISDINLPILPWETKDKLSIIYNRLVKEVNNLEKDLNKEILQFTDFEELYYLGNWKEAIEALRAYRMQLQNEILKQDLKNISKIDDVIKALENIRDLDLKPSIALEKYITMALNIINDAKEIKANSLVGDDNEFIFTAPANKPDIECYYDNFSSICEVTMLSGRDQWHNEGQPVMRHLRDFESKSTSNDNYCLFIAPKLHRDTINTFWISVKYEYEGAKQKIVPLTIKQIIEILKIIKELKEKNRFFSHLQFKQLLEDILELKEKFTNSEEWIREIPNTILNFKEEILCS